MSILDYLKGMFGAALGSSLGTSGAIHGAYIGMTRGILATSSYTFGNLNKGIAGAIGYAALGKPGLQEGVKGGLGTIPSMVGESAQKIVNLSIGTIILIVLIIIILVGEK
jgi:hypothetical protein